MPLEMVTRKLVEQGEDGLIVYGYKFRPPLMVGGNGHRGAQEMAQVVLQEAIEQPVAISR